PSPTPAPDSLSHLSLEEQAAFPPTSSAGVFHQIGRKHGTDKITHHGYHRFYPRFIEHFQSLRGASMLE
ncbi:hypothetical protein B484DRAFT_397403, partial [Ochromonadaceae sp. CCMP2298]